MKTLVSRSTLIFLAVVCVLAMVALVAVTTAIPVVAADPAPFTLDRPPSNVDVVGAAGDVGYTATRRFKFFCPDQRCDYGIVEIYAGAVLSTTGENLVMTVQSSADGVNWSAHTEAMTLTGDPPANNYVMSPFRGQEMAISIAVGSTGRYTPTLDVVFSNR